MRIARRHEEPEIPTASMADIAFLLTIFFIAVGVFAATRGLVFELPGRQGAEVVEGDGVIAVRVRHDGPGRWSLLLDGRPARIEDLLAYVDTRLRRSPELPVLLYTDPEAPYQAMIAVYDELMRADQAIGRRIGRLCVPTSADVREYARVLGRDLFAETGP